jgi:hypothetical protein
MLQELLNCDTHVADDLAEKEGRDVPPSVNRHRSAASVGVPELLVGPPLPDLLDS